MVGLFVRIRRLITRAMSEYMTESEANLPGTLISLGTLMRVPGNEEKMPRLAPACLIGCAA